MISGVTETTQSTLMLKKKKEMRAVDDALEFMKEEFRKRMAACDEREAKFKEKQADMKAMVLRFQQFIQENDAKRTRAEAKAQSEAQAFQKLSKDAKTLQQQLTSLQQEKLVLEKRLESLDRYTKYLESVVNSTESDYDEVSELLSRYRNLYDANKDLHRQVDNNVRLTEALRLELASKRREGENVALTLSSEAQQWVKKIETMAAKSAVLDVTRDQTDELMRERQLDSGKIVTGIHNLYMRVKMSMRGPQKALPAAGKEKSIEYLTQCLDVVGVRAKTLSDIVNGYAAYVDAKAKELARIKAAQKADAAAAAGLTLPGATAAEKSGGRGAKESGSASVVDSLASVQSLSY